jgi:hypothetical protein
MSSGWAVPFVVGSDWSSGSVVLSCPAGGSSWSATFRVRQGSVIPRRNDEGSQCRDPSQARDDIYSEGIGYMSSGWAVPFVVGSDWSSGSVVLSCPAGGSPWSATAVAVPPLP